MAKIKLIFILIILISFSVTGELYRVFADREFGFWAVRAENVSNNTNFMNKTLSINTGDVVDFVNMDGNDDRITIISDNTLWEGGVLLSGTGKRFNFTFNSSGYFRFHIVENTHVSLNASNFTGINRTDQTKTYTICSGKRYGDEEEYDVNDTSCYTFTVHLNNKASQAEYLKLVTDTETFVRQSLLVKVSGKQVGNGTFPIINTTKIKISSGYVATQNRTKISVNASPKPKAGIEMLMNATPPAPKVLESYHEFTLFETFKRWFLILKGESKA